MTDRDKLLDLVENIRRLIEENMSADLSPILAAGADVSVGFR